MLRTLILLLFAVFFLGGSPIEASAEEGSAAKHAETNAKDAASSRTEATRLPADVSTSHRLDVEGRHLEFTATAGEPYSATTKTLRKRRWRSSLISSTARTRRSAQ